MIDAKSQRIVEEITVAFSTVTFPGINRAVMLGNRAEHDALRLEFGQMTDWRKIPATLLDSAPDGFGSALSFLSPVGFQFYIPAYMIADLAGYLGLVDPAFFLCIHVVDLTTPDGVKVETNLNANYPKQGFDRIQIFDASQCQAIAKYCERMAFERDDPCLLNCSRFWHSQSVARSTARRT